MFIVEEIKHLHAQLGSARTHEYVPGAHSPRRRTVKSEDNEMSKNTNPQDRQAKKDKRNDDLDAALEESEEQDEESAVVEEADANLKQDSINLTGQK